MNKKAALIILDGWGHGKKDHSDAIFNAKTPFVDSLYQSYPNAELRTDGLHVGLPKGQMGNSEVGHMNIGAGRVVYQDLAKINKSVEDGEFQSIPTLVETFAKVKKNGGRIHFMGLLGYGGVHANQDHLVALCKMASDYDLKDVFIHGFTDGRDTDPNSALKFIEKLQQDIKHTPAKIATLIGRYFAMDRDNRWERIKKAHDLLTKAKGEAYSSATKAVLANYAAGTTDEFLEPSKILDENGSYNAEIKEGDTVICFNFRTDRCREITIALTQKDLPEFDLKKLELDYITMTNYDSSFVGVKIVFDKENIANTLGEFLSTNHKTQLRIAETEKYPHVSFFFSGGREKKFEGESRIMINSPKVATYDLQPEMSALEVKDAVIEHMKTKAPDFICLNFANPDMVGHTGVYDAIKKACETVDQCLQEVVEKGLKQNYSFVIIADHGNADYAVNIDGSPNTAHSLNPVPVFLIDDSDKKIKNGILADVAPTIIELMELIQPKEMTGQSLLTD